MSQLQALGLMGSRRDVEIAEALRHVVEQFNRIGREAHPEASVNAQQEFLVMIAPLVATEIHRITGEDREVPEQEALPGDSVVPGWRLLVTAADEVVVRSPEGGPGAMTIPADGGTLSASLLRELVKQLVGGTERHHGCGMLLGERAQSEAVTALRA